MKNAIQLLPDHVANQIAAGEVVQRPASVVKELLENSIDAEAKNIQLVIKDAGKTLIQIVDDGLGMTMTDARLAFERHATSKIKKAEDLFNLHTNGFRGEALASIAAVCQVELKTKTKDCEVGTEIQIEGSEIKKQEPCVTKSGSSISVKNLFFNIPARRNFLKSDNVEQRHIIDEFQRVAMAHPEVSFKMYHNGTSLFNLPASHLRQRIVGIMGNKANENLVPIDEKTELVNLSGYVGKPEFAKRTRGEQFFFVNHRFIKSSYLHHAVTSAFEGLLKEKTHPSYFLNLAIHPKSIDINIHPTKTEIKFEDEHAIYSILRAAVKHSLGQFQITPVLDFDHSSDLDPSYNRYKSEAKNPTIEVDRSFNPFKTEGESEVKSSQFPSHFKSNHPTKKSTKNWEDLFEDTKDFQSESIESQINLESENNSQNLMGFDEESVQKEPTSFQLQNKYIVTTLKSGLLIIDQHRAHSRILFEDLINKFKDKPALSQQLMFPLILEINAYDFQILSELKVHLNQVGFDFKKFESTEIQISGIPVFFSESQIGSLFDELKSNFKEGIPSSEINLREILAKSIAKTSAIKAGKKLKQEEQMEIVSQLFSCAEPTKSPSNKRIFATMSSEDFDKKLM